MQESLAAQFSCLVVWLFTHWAGLWFWRAAFCLPERRIYKQQGGCWPYETVPFGSWWGKLPLLPSYIHWFINFIHLSVHSFIYLTLLTSLRVSIKGQGQGQFNSKKLSLSPSLMLDWWWSLKKNKDKYTIIWFGLIKMQFPFSLDGLCTFKPASI